MATEETAEPLVKAVVNEIVDINHSMPGDYAIFVTVNVLEEGGLVYDWQWFWAPKVPVHRGSIDGR